MPRRIKQTEDQIDLDIDVKENTEQAVDNKTGNTYVDTLKKKLEQLDTWQGVRVAATMNLELIAQKTPDGYPILVLRTANPKNRIVLATKQHIEEFLHIVKLIAENEDNLKEKVEAVKELARPSQPRRKDVVDKL